MKYNLSIKNIIVSIIILASIFTIGSKYYQYKFNKQNRQYFLNHMYFELEDCIMAISQIESLNGSINSSDINQNQFYKLLFSLDYIRNLNFDSAIYIHDKNSNALMGVWPAFELIEMCLGNGLSINGNLVCNNFLQDGLISDKEINFLKTLKKDLENLKTGLYSEKTHQEDPDISFKEYDKITKPFVEKYNTFNIENIGLGN